MVPITTQVQALVRQSGITCGLCILFCPHTTAGLTINEQADPDVARDLVLGLGKAFPDRPEFAHFEGNSAAHLKTLATGSSLTLLIEKGQLLLGRWQGLYIAEYDGPRQRDIHVRLSPENS